MKTQKKIEQMEDSCFLYLRYLNYYINTEIFFDFYTLGKTRLLLRERRRKMTTTVSVILLMQLKKVRVRMDMSMISLVVLK
jgi:hypothetical protein